MHTNIFACPTSKILDFSMPIIYTEMERSSWWQPWYSLETLKTSFNVSSEYQSYQPDDVSVSVHGLQDSFAKIHFPDRQFYLSWAMGQWDMSRPNVLLMRYNTCDHYSDVIMSTMVSQITSLMIVYLIVYIQAQIKESIKAPRHWSLWGVFTGDRTKGQ